MAEDFMRNINFKKIIDISIKNKYKYAELLEFYYNVIYSGLDRENERYYFNARKFLFKNHSLFSEKEIKDITSKLANYCVEKNLPGVSKFQRELFNINKLRLKLVIAIYTNGRIGKSLYKQIVFNATSLKEIRWAERFVDEFTPLLHEEHRDAMKQLANAYSNFNSKKFDEALDSLNKFKSADVTDRIQVKNLIARTYYEMKEYELLLYHIDSTKQFLKKSKNLSNILREANRKFFSYLHSMVNAIENNNSKKLIKLEEIIINDNAVNNKAWLLEKLAETKKM